MASKYDTSKSRGQVPWKPKKKMCTKSKVYDAEHYAEFGHKCTDKHELYHWMGLQDNRVCLIADSLCKWVSCLVHVETQSVPGLTLTDAFVKMCRGDLNIHGHELLVLFV